MSLKRCVERRLSSLQEEKTVNARLRQRNMNNLERYYEDFNVVLSDIRSLLEEFRVCEAGKKNLAEKTKRMNVLERKKTTFQAADRAIDEALEIIGQMEIEVLHIPFVLRQQEKTKIQSCQLEISHLRKEFSQESLQLYEPYTESFTLNQDLESLDQRNRLLIGTQKLEESSERLKNVQRIAEETEEIGTNILKDLSYQREQIMMARNTLVETDNYINKSMRTLKTMTQR
ncbi:hypothetical protein PORY_002772 [Pneumocystis oryctolagi]|uniref:Uncharacterized protein n=1 Tax=Pneumocystis oryctolagi TaxID=42067 RepID=A0ACB7CA89_9ASCO|nr:hypothetical protein PORY_002772 [Pneumocystis oryctolagi]